MSSSKELIIGDCRGVLFEPTCGHFCGNNRSADCSCALCTSQGMTLGGNISIEIPGCAPDSSPPLSTQDNSSTNGSLDDTHNARLIEKEPLGTLYENASKVYKLSFRKGCPTSHETMSSFYNEKTNMSKTSVLSSESCTIVTARKKTNKANAISNFEMFQNDTKGYHRGFHDPSKNDLIKTPEVNNTSQRTNYALSQSFNPIHAQIKLNPNSKLTPKIECIIGQEETDVCQGDLQKVNFNDMKCFDIKMNSCATSVRGRHMTATKELMLQTNTEQNIPNGNGKSEVEMSSKFNLDEEESVVNADEKHTGDTCLNDKTASPEQILANSTQTKQSHDHGNTQVGFSASFTEDVDTIVENVFRANLPELLLGRFPESISEVNQPVHKTQVQEPVDEIVVTSQLGNVKETKNQKKKKEEIREECTEDTGQTPDDSQFRVTIEKGVDLHMLPNARPNKGITEKRSIAHNVIVENPRLSRFVKLVKCMIDRLPSQEIVCKTGASKNKYISYILSSDVKEVLFPGCNLLPSLMSVKSLPASSLVLCSTLCKKKFEESFIRVNAGQYMIAIDAFSNKEWCKKLMNLNIATHERKTNDEGPNDNPLLGEVHHSNHSLPMIYRFTKYHRKALIYVPAADLAKTFPESEYVLKNLENVIAKGTLKHNLRNRTATTDEAKCIMRYKAAIGSLDTKDPSWKYLTSRSILVCWEDFKRVFGTKAIMPGVSIGRIRKEGKNESNCFQDTPLKKTFPKHQPRGVHLIKSALKGACPQNGKKMSLFHERRKPKKRKRSATKLELLKKRYHTQKFRPQKSPSPKLIRTSTPVTEVSKVDYLEKRCASTLGEQLVPFMRRQIAVDANIPREPSHEKKDAAYCNKDAAYGNKDGKTGGKGLWKMQQDILKQESGKRQDIPAKRRVLKLKPIGSVLSSQREKSAPKTHDTKKILAQKESEDMETHSSIEKKHLERVLANAVNDNPFNQTLESMRMIKRLDTELSLGQENRKVPSPLRTDISEMFLCEQAASFSFEACQTHAYGKDKEAHIIENPNFSDISTTSFEDSKSNALSIVSNDSLQKIVDVSSSDSQKSFRGRCKEITRLQPVQSDYSPVRVTTKVKTKSKALKLKLPINIKTDTALTTGETIKLFENVNRQNREQKATTERKERENETENSSEQEMIAQPTKNSKKKKKKAHSHFMQGNISESVGDLSGSWSSTSPQVMMENQRIIMKIIKSKSKRKSHDKYLHKQNEASATYLHQEQGQPSNNAKTEKENFRLFPRLSHSDEPSKSGLVVVENGGRHSLPYVLNNGYPYIDARSVASLFPQCHYSSVNKVLRNTKFLARHRLMCSYEEAKLLNEEGRQFARKPVSSGSWMVRVDRVGENLQQINRELEHILHGRVTGSSSSIP